MSKLQISKEQRALIESVIRENPKFKGNEKLIDDFCIAIYKKSYLLIDAIRDMSRLRRHLSMICDSCIDQVVSDDKKNRNRKQYSEIINKSRRSEEIVSLKRNRNEDIRQTVKPKKTNSVNVVNLKEEIQRSEKYDSVDDLPDPIEFCPRKKASVNAVEALIKIVKRIDKEHPQKKYYQIFSLRYIKRYNQMEIARYLNISQIELSKRFVELIAMTRDNIR